MAVWRSVCVLLWPNLSGLAEFGADSTFEPPRSDLPRRAQTVESPCVTLGGQEDHTGLSRQFVDRPAYAGYSLGPKCSLWRVRSGPVALCVGAQAGFRPIWKSAHQRASAVARGPPGACELPLKATASRGKARLHGARGEQAGSEQPPQLP